MVKQLLVISAIAACQGQGGGTSEPPPPVGSGSAAPRGSGGSFGNRDAAAVTEEGSDDGSARVKPEEPEPVDVGKQLVELGAVPAWQAVVDRASYLARRGQRGVVFGTVGGPLLVPGPPPPPGDAGVRDAGLVPSDYLWLVDDTDGNGALAIRVKPGPKPLAQGSRVALGGAWALDDARSWYWKVDAMTALPAASPSELKDPSAAPGHAIVNGELPSGARTISVAKDGDAAYFQIVGAPPAIDGDGWPVADELGNPTYALLNLPGERPSYGAQDLRAPDERWQLKRGQTYWVRIGHVRKRGPDKPALINARTAPVRVM